MTSKRSNVDTIFDHMGFQKEITVGTLAKWTDLDRQQVHTSMHMLVKEGSVKKLERPGGQSSLFKKVVKSRPKRGKKKYVNVDGIAELDTAEKPDTAMAHAMKKAKREQFHAIGFKPHVTVSVEPEETKPETSHGNGGALSLDSIPDAIRAVRAMLDLIESRWNAEVEASELKALECEEKSVKAEKKLAELKELVGSL